ncbi:4101_t:CDS:2, partial [Acaulospora colombiana]
SGEDEEGLLNKGLFAIRRGGQEISARLNSLPSLPGGNRKKQSVDLSSSHTLFPPSISSARVSPDIGGPRRLYSDGHTSPFIPEERALSADEGTRKHQRPLLSSFSMHSALTTPNFSMSFTTTPPSMTPPRFKTKSLDLPPSRPTTSRRPSAQRTIPPTTAPLEVNSDDEGVPRRLQRNRFHPRNLSKNGRDSVYLHNHIERRLSMSDLSDWRDVPCLNSEQMKIDVHYVSSLAELSRRKRRLQLAADSVKELMGSLVLVEEILRHGQERQKLAREDLNRKVDNILPAVEELSAIRALPMETRSLTFSAIPRDAPFKSNAITAAETLKSSKYKAYGDIERIATLKADVQRHRDQFWQQRRLAYLPPETKKDEEDLTLSLGSKCPFLWSLQFMYKLMLLTVLWAGMFRRGEIQSSVDDGWRRSTVFGTRLDRKGRTQADIDNIDREVMEDRELEWTMKPSMI